MRKTTTLEVLSPNGVVNAHGVISTKDLKISRINCCERILWKF
jgi:hypothetical protein